ncbi:MAG: hypothetical protein QOD06_2005 [Candidatus Binatota bacterium]|jgi:chromosome segregation ATPase|nr:hypothetical protein [Candidatus Binatota bacterium]
MLDAWILVAIALAATAVSLLALRRTQQKLEGVFREVELLENHNRAAEEQKHGLEVEGELLKARLADREASIEELRARGAELESGNAALEKRSKDLETERSSLEQALETARSDRMRSEDALRSSEAACAKLEEARAALAADLGALRADHETLRSGMSGFQGEWRRQLSTLEEEIGTLIRQLGEFRKGTRLPLPDGEHEPEEETAAFLRR